MYRVTQQDQLLALLEQGQDLSMLRLEGLTLTGTLSFDLVGGMFVGCHLDGIACVGADWSEVSFIDCHLTNMHLEDVALFGASFERCDLRGTRLQHCDLSATRFLSCQMDGLQFDDCACDASQGISPSLAA